MRIGVENTLARASFREREHCLVSVAVLGENEYKDAPRYLHIIIILTSGSYQCRTVEISQSDF
jgi:hypothetical protein